MLILINSTTWGKFNRRKVISCRLTKVSPTKVLKRKEVGKICHFFLQSSLRRMFNMILYP